MGYLVVGTTILAMDEKNKTFWIFAFRYHCSSGLQGGQLLLELINPFPTTLKTILSSFFSQIHVVWRGLQKL
jgi:hypothetical protein